MSVAVETSGVVLRAWIFIIAVMALVAVGNLSAVQADPGRRAPDRAYDIAIHPGNGAPVRLHVEEQGAGPPLLFLHGMGGSSYSFRHLVAPLAQTHRVITLDLKGFGASEKPFDTAYAPVDQAQLVVGFLRQRRLTGVTLAGHSYGGAVALMTVLALNRHEPGRIKRLILMNAPAYPQELPRAQQFLTMPVLPYVALTVVPPFLNIRESLAAKHPAAPHATDADVIAYADPLYDPAARHALIATARAMSMSDGRDAIPYYHTIRQPALIIWCRNDPTVPLTSGERLAKHLPNARLHVLDRCHHMPAEEQPRETTNLIRDFLARQ